MRQMGFNKRLSSCIVGHVGSMLGTKNQVIGFMEVNKKLFVYLLLFITTDPPLLPAQKFNWIHFTRTQHLTQSNFTNLANVYQAIQ